MTAGISPAAVLRPDNEDIVKEVLEDALKSPLKGKGLKPSYFGMKKDRKRIIPS